MKISKLIDNNRICDIKLTNIKICDIKLTNIKICDIKLTNIKIYDIKLTNNFFFKSFRVQKTGRNGATKFVSGEILECSLRVSLPRFGHGCDVEKYTLAGQSVRGMHGMGKEICDR